MKLEMDCLRIVALMWHHIHTLTINDQAVETSHFPHASMEMNVINCHIPHAQLCLYINPLLTISNGQHVKQITRNWCQPIDMPLPVSRAAAKHVSKPQDVPIETDRRS